MQMKHSELDAALEAGVTAIRTVVLKLEAAGAYRRTVARDVTTWTPTVREEDVA